MPETKQKRNSKFYSIHTHSRYSFNDALPSPKEIVERAVELGYPALGLTDHGNMAGSVELYRECRKAGIKPMPGSELYLVKDREDKKAKRYHLCLVAYTTQGYRNLVHISSLTHKNFHHKPLIDLSDMAMLKDEGRTEGIALTTGCYFSLVIQTLITEGYWAAKQLVATYASWFDTYVEIQMHRIEQEGLSEEMIARLLYRIAQELDLPVVITQDSHYVHLEDKTDHEALKSLTSWSTDPDSAQFPGDGFHMADEAWMKDHHTKRIYKAGIKGLKRLLNKHDMYIEEIEEYHYKVPQLYPDPDRELKEICTESLYKKFAKENDRGRVPTDYLEQLVEELDVIKISGMANYLLMVKKVCDHMTQEQIFYQVRGSAAGSLVCWLLDITNVDPIRWKLRFDRFLSKDRTKPPDIDIDIEHIRRKEVMDWISETFAVLQICNWGTYGLDDDGSKGSLKVKYMMASRKLGGPDDWKDVPIDDIHVLSRLSKRELVSGPGVHAAGMIVTSSHDELESMVPMQWIASSKTMVSQYDMEVVESIGLVKLDVLGVRTLTVMRKAMENLGRTTDDIEDIPINDRKVYSMIAKGDTDGLFQLEGFTTRRMVTALKPKKINDVIAAMALFRPGVMSSGATDTYLKRNAKTEKMPVFHQIIMEQVKDTQGILLYQDQVIAILRDIGFDPDQLTAFLKAIKASNKDVGDAQKVVDHYLPIIAGMCREHCIPEEEIKWLIDKLHAFGEYSFNRAHATVYGITAARSAYLAYHHPLEFYAALLAVATGSDKEKDYRIAVRRRGIRVSSPDVNVSGAEYSVDTAKNRIRKGLGSIKGVGIVASREIEAKQPFDDLDDFIAKVSPSKVTGIKPYLKDGDTSVGTLGLLIEAGAMKSIGVEVCEP